MLMISDDETGEWQNQEPNKCQQADWHFISDRHAALASLLIARHGASSFIARHVASPLIGRHADASLLTAPTFHHTINSACHQLSTSPIPPPSHLTIPCNIPTLPANMSNASTVFNFPHLGTPTSHDQTNPLLLDDSSTHTLFGSNARPGNSALPLPSTAFIDALLIDNLAKDFALEEIQRANLHAFVQVISVPLISFFCAD